MEQLIFTKEQIIDLINDLKERAQREKDLSLKYSNLLMRIQYHATLQLISEFESYLQPDFEVKKCVN